MVPAFPAAHWGLELVLLHMLSQDLGDPTRPPRAEEVTPWGVLTESVSPSPGHRTLAHFYDPSQLSLKTDSLPHPSSPCLLLGAKVQPVRTTWGQVKGWKVALGAAGGTALLEPALGAG